MKISVLTPTYKSLNYLKEALDSLFAQDYKNFEVIICNDSQEDALELQKFLVKNYLDFFSQIKLIQNEINLGYSLNIRKCFENSDGDVVFLFAQDDIITKTSHFSEIINIYENSSDIGFVSRPYFWFDGSINHKLRRTPKSDLRVIKSNSSKKDILTLISSLGQLSGLSFRRYPGINYFFTPFIFTAHVYPFLQNFLISDCYFLDYDSIAVRASSSQTTFVSSIYNPSPTLTWVEMSNEIFKNNKYLREIFVENFGKNYIGLLQIKNYGYFKDLLSDIYYLVKFRPKNLISPIFWVFVFTVILVPKRILIAAISLYKNHINSKFID
jgi:glycosyltransferase involved in cell wall biosynthesis